ncbi:MAG: GNAT family N-acetyltransferase [Defluviitaleaceae bacterium]|nr:GNAT family N-acetyltransferase [Defluviitaleaceae bacterium]
MRLKLLQSDVSALSRVWPKMRRDFHGSELIPKIYLRRALRKDAYDLFLLTDESGAERGYAVVNPRSLYGYVLLLYIGVEPELRDRGLGGELLRLLTGRYREKQGMLVELTHVPGDEADLDRRRKFYYRAGFVDVPCVYNLFGLDCGLMCRGLSGTADIGEVAPFVIRDLYGRNMPEAMVERFIKIGKLRGEIL